LANSHLEDTFDHLQFDIEVEDDIKFDDQKNDQHPKLQPLRYDFFYE